jgi:hypothetical protein
MGLRMTTMPGVALWLAAVRPELRDRAFEGLLWLGGIVLAVSVAVVGLAALRRRLRLALPGRGYRFTLADLRKWRDRGDLSAEEYDRLLRVGFVESSPSKVTDSRGLSDKKAG